MAKISNRRHLIETAMGLFHNECFNAITIDTILAEAGVARMTLYKHFKSKDELILAAQRRLDEDFRRWFRGQIDARAKWPEKRLLVIFDVLDDCFDGKAFPGTRFLGCAYINRCWRFGKTSSQARHVAAEHNRLMLDYVTRIAEQARADDPDNLARQLMLLAAGAIVSMYVHCDPDAGRRAKRITADLINACCAAPVDA